MTQRIRPPASASSRKVKRQPLPESISELKNCFTTYFGFTFDIVLWSKQCADEKCKTQKKYLAEANQKATEAKIRFFRTRNIELVFLDEQISYSDELPFINRTSSNAQIKSICIAARIIEKRIKKLSLIQEDMSRFFTQFENKYEGNRVKISRQLAQFDREQSQGTAFSSVTPKILEKFVFKEKLSRFSRSFLESYDEFQHISSEVERNIRRYEELVDSMDVGVPLFLYQLQCI